MRRLVWNNEDNNHKCILRTPAGRSYYREKPGCTGVISWGQVMIFVRLIHRDSTEKEPSTSDIKLTVTLMVEFTRILLKKELFWMLPGVKATPPDIIIHHTYLPLTLLWRRPLSYRNQSIDLLCKSMDWFLCDRDLHHERVNVILWTMMLQGK